MKKLIHGFFGIFGLEVRRKLQTTAPVRTGVTKAPAPDSMMAGMLRAKTNWKINPGSVIDLGAAAGTWTEKAAAVWAESSFILFEPLEERKAELVQLAKSNARIRPVFAAAGNQSGKVLFAVSDDLDGSGVVDSRGQQNAKTREVELTTIDDQVKRLQLSGPFVIKFDTHGFELPILEGAIQTLKKTDLVIMECYGFRLTENSLLLHEMCQHMSTLGFDLADVVDIMRRPDDQLFWQCDAFFLRNDHPAFTRKTYR